MSTGRMEALDAATGRLLWARETVHQTVIRDIDPGTGRATLNPDLIKGVGETVRIPVDHLMRTRANAGPCFFMPDTLLQPSCVGQKVGAGGHGRGERASPNPLVLGVSLLGRTFEADPLWPHRLVRCEVDLSAETIRVHALRGRDPYHQPLLREVPYRLPRRPFHE